MFIWVYRSQSGEFLYGGPYDPPYDPATQGLARYREHPDRRLERFDATGKDLKRPATAQEITAYDAALLDTRSRQAIVADPTIDALVRWVAAKLGLTESQANDEIVAILKTSSR